MSNADPTSSPRRRGLWWKLPAVGLVILIVFALLGHALWTGKERARAAALVSDIRGRGEPIDVADLVEPHVPDATNIVALLRAAAAAMKSDADREQRRRDLETDLDDAFALPLNDAERTILRDHTAANADALALLAGLDARRGVAWDTIYATPLLLMADPEVNTARKTANLLGDAATLAADEGRSADAVAAIRDLGPIATATGAKPSLVGYLVATGIHALAADRAIELAPTLTVDNAAARADVERLIAELLDDAAIERIVRRGVTGERVHGHDAFAAMVAGKLGLTQFTAGGLPPTGVGNTLARWAITPLLHRGDASVLAYHTELLRQVDAPDLAAFKSRAATLNQIEASVRASNVDLFAQIMLPSLGRAMTTRYRAVAERHLAACALAIRLHALDHDGQRPATLAELVPAYLPRVPTDATDGKPIRYDPARAILWHVGENEVDDGGDATVRQPRYARERWQMRDGVAFLDRQPRVAPATMPTTTEVIE